MTEFDRKQLNGMFENHIMLSFFAMKVNKTTTKKGF